MTGARIKSNFLNSQNSTIKSNETKECDCTSGISQLGEET